MAESLILNEIKQNALVTSTLESKIQRFEKLFSMSDDKCEGDILEGISAFLNSKGGGTQ